MRVAILGAHGFIGRNLGYKLHALGHEVTGYVLNHDLSCSNQFKCESVLELLNTPSNDLKFYDVTINLAARRATSLQPYTQEQVSKFTFEIPKEYILRTAGPKSLVINSSTYIQNFEGIPGRTVDSYGAAKEKLSIFLAQDSLKFQFKSVDVYFFTLYGEGDRPSHLVPLLLESAFSGNEISLSPGYQLMNLLYIDDAVENILKILERPTTIGYHKYYLWSDEYLSVRELVERIQSSIGREINTNWGGRDYVGHEMMKPWTIPMAQIEGFEVKTTLNEGIKKIWSTLSLG